MLTQKRTMQLMAPLESLTGKFALQRETCASRYSTSSGTKVRYKYFGARITSAHYPHMGGTLTKQSFYLRKHGRYNGYSVNERNSWQTFGNAVKQANLDLKNISVIPTIKDKFASNKMVYGVEPRTYTMRGWVIAVYDSFYRYEEGQGAIDWANLPA